MTAVVVLCLVVAAVIFLWIGSIGGAADEVRCDQLAGKAGGYRQ